MVTKLDAYALRKGLMEFFEVVQKRRSVRKFKTEMFPDAAVQKALEAAVLAPNSSNTQTWDFHWIKNPELKKKVVHACLSQSAARTATQLIVVSANPKNWRRSNPKLIEWVKALNVHKSILIYYEKLVPFTYSWGFFNLMLPLKWVTAFGIGLFRPIMRGPFSRQSITGTAVKSAALACENFVLAITAQGGATCMMEGFDEWRLHRILKLSCYAEIVMVIGVGYQDEKGTWGPQFRIPNNEVIHLYE